MRGAVGLGRGVAAAALSLQLVGCPAGEPAAAQKTQASAGSTKAPGSAAVNQGDRVPRVGPKLPPPKARVWRVPVGITLPIIPKKGLGPIRFGATVETIERLIAEPCEERRQAPSGQLVCRYSAQAVEFFLDEGGLTKIHAHRGGRVFRAEPRLEYGIFNGRFLEGASFGMLISGVQEFLGKPVRVEKVEQPNDAQTIERHHYPDFVLEYDRMDNGRLVLGGVILTRPTS